MTTMAEMMHLSQKVGLYRTMMPLISIDYVWLERFFLRGEGMLHV
jgi:hypothetical protein